FAETQDKSTACQMITETKLLAMPSEQVFGAIGLESCDLTLNLEGKALNSTIHIFSQVRDYKLVPPLEVTQVKAAQYKYTGVVVDLDFFTPKAVGRSQFGVDDWLDQVIHVLRRDLEKVLGNK